MSDRKWEYRVQHEIYLPPPETRANPDSPVMDSEDYEHQLNRLDEEGWEFVGIAQKWWHGRDHPQTIWIFRRPYSSKRSKTEIKKTRR